MANELLIDVELLDYNNEKIKAWASAQDTQTLKDAKDYAKEYADTVSNNAANAVAGNKTLIENLEKEVSNLKNTDTGIIERVEELEGEVGELGDLETTSKGDLVSAINEVRNSVNSGSSSAAITIVTSTTSEGSAKTYTIKQGSNIVGTIDIPKDMVVTSGTVVTNPAGEEEGTYIKLILANVDDPLYINVGALVDIYTAQSNATQIQLAINSSTREISAKIVAGSVGTTELSNGAVTTAKIADANITLAKLSTDLQTYIAKANSSVQSVTEGTTNGTINVDGTNVSVHGLGSAAYTDSTAYDAAGAANIVQSNLNNEISRAKDAEAQVLAEAKEYANKVVSDKASIKYVDEEIEKIPVSTDTSENIVFSNGIIVSYDSSTETYTFS